MKIYVASSWRNLLQPTVVAALRKDGHDVYDFKNPPNKSGFNWKEIDPDWQAWKPEQYIQALEHPLSEEGFESDMSALERAEVVVLVLPCGASAHAEAGWAAGAGKDVIVLIPDAPLADVYDTKASKRAVDRVAWEPELMYKMFSTIETTVEDVVDEVRAFAARDDLAPRTNV